MTEQEKASFLRNVSRAPGKRAIKPTAYFFNDMPDGDEDDDNDFAVDSGSSGSSSSGSSDEEKSDAGSDDDDSNENDAAKSTTSTIELDEDTQDAKFGVAETQEKKAEVIYCCICLRPESKDMSISKCDRCNIAVHDACYGIVDDDAESVASNGEVPWFCEPCMFGLVEPPNCEFCPSRLGAFKKTDIGENWAHVLCGQYIPKITYADNVNLIGISYQEIDHKTFGKKSCTACSDALESRCGIAVPCEAGLCKNSFHVTCAQKLGFLVELDENECTGHLFCKRHTLSEDLKRRKKIFEKMSAYEERRMNVIKRRQISENHRKKYDKQLAEYNQRVENLNNINYPGPANSKRVRMIQTSSEIVEGFAVKAEMALAINRDRYVKEFSRIPTENINLGDGLSYTDESARYFEYRENVLFDEAEQYLEELRINREEAQEKIKNAQKDIETLQTKNPEILESSKEASDLCSAFIGCLELLGAKGVSKACLRLPKKHPPKPIVKVLPSTSAKTKQSKKRKMDASETPPKLLPSPSKRRLSNESPEVITLSDDEMPMLAKASTKENQKPPKKKPKMKKETSKSSIIEIESSNDSSPIDAAASSSLSASQTSVKSTTKKNGRASPGVPKTCFACEKDHDTHLMPFCDVCKHYYHLACLDPPLTKMPKTTRYYGWTCADCYEIQQEEWEKKHEINVDEDKPNNNEKDEGASSSKKSKRNTSNE